MFERFTERARQVVVLAQEEARQLKHNYIGTEHILLGLLREEEGLAAQALESLGISIDRVRAQIVRIVGNGEEVTSGQIPFTPRAKKILELALREALSLGHNYIGTEHILLGLVRENEGVAARILVDFDADSERIRNEVIRMLSGPRPVHRLDRPDPVTTASAPDRAMAAVERDIRNTLGREPDNGDLLVILASLPHGVVARALSELGIDDAKLAEALTRARAAGPDQIEDQLRLIQRQKDEAIDRGDLDEATALRARERVLEAADRVDLITEVRARLGLSPGVP
jgi:hypothetical protein